MDKLIEIFEILTSTLLTVALLFLLRRIYIEVRAGRFMEKKDKARFFFRTNFFLRASFFNGTCACGWLCLLKYKDEVQPHFTLLAIILGILSAAVITYCIFHIWRYSRKAKKYGRKNGCEVQVVSCEDKDSGDAQIRALLQSGTNDEPIVIDLKKAVPHPVEPNCAVFPPVMEGQGKPYFDKLSPHKEYAVYGNYPVTAQKEFNVDTNGFSFLVIYGTHINGGFCCIPNWQFGCELSTPDDTFYNTEMLSRRFDPHIAKAIAYGIRDACVGGETESYAEMP